MCRLRIQKLKIGQWGGFEEKVILVSENDLFLTLGLGTSNARNENLRPLLNTNIPLISGDYGLRNHFWPLESRFLMRKNEKKSIFSKLPQCPILSFWIFYLHIIICQFKKKSTVIHFFFVSLHVPATSDINVSKFILLVNWSIINLSSPSSPFSSSLHTKILIIDNYHVALKTHPCNFPPPADSTLAPLIIPPFHEGAFTVDCIVYSSNSIRF